MLKTEHIFDRMSFGTKVCNDILLFCNDLCYTQDRSLIGKIMGEKDIIEKTLEDYNDVFADIVNVFLFNGKQRIKENDLVNLRTRSVLKADGKLHEQERDVVKRWGRENIRIAFLGIENQTDVDGNEPLRVVSYDGSLYKEQLIEIDKCIREKKIPPKPVPVITLVIYFGSGKWKHTNLKEIFEIPDYLDDYVSDY